MSHIFPIDCKMARNYGIVTFIVLLVYLVKTVLPIQNSGQPDDFKYILDKGSSSLLPRMEYNEWTPLGRGDPLKNDPTFDYSPPVLDKVKYWVNPLFRTPDPPIIPENAHQNLTEYQSTSPTIVVSKINQKQHVKSDIKRFFNSDYKNESPIVHPYTMNMKYNVKVQKPQYVSYQNYYNNNNILKQPHPPPVMLLPPPPVKSNNYGSVLIENATNTDYIAWESTKTQLATVETITNFATAPPKVQPGLLTTEKSMYEMEAWNITDRKHSSENPSYLHILLGKEVSKTTYNITTVSPTTMETPLTTQPLIVHYKQEIDPLKAPMHLIIQGHSKVKKYGATNKDTLLGITLQDTNDISNANFKLNYLTKRDSRHFRFEDFLPFDEDTVGEAFKDIIDKQAEGSGFGAILTRAIFPSELLTKPSSTQHIKPKLKEAKA